MSGLFLDCHLTKSTHTSYVFVQYTLKGDYPDYTSWHMEHFLHDLDYSVLLGGVEMLCRLFACKIMSTLCIDPQPQQS